MPKSLAIALCAALAPLAAAAVTTGQGDARPTSYAPLHAAAAPWTLPPVPHQESAILAAKLKGRWENTQTDQRIELTLNRTGLSRWTVDYQGKAWSDLVGTWRAVDRHLVLDNEMGSVEFAVRLTGDGELILADTDAYDPIEPLTFSRLD